MKPFANGVRIFALPMQASSRNDKIVLVILGNAITCMILQGQQHYLWRTVAQDDERIDMRVQLRRIHMQSVNNLLLRSQAFQVWKESVCAKGVRENPFQCDLIKFN
ncbi:MAG TPA: hypothetical protein VLA60_14005 [Nitrospirales bacterium]|nr:hypothetical protein [Nitrospirales bacterium]